MSEQRKRTVIIWGSSRRDGDTAELVQLLQQHVNSDAVCLMNYYIDYYDYEYSNAGDDFIPLMEEVVRYDNIILVSPVYWYSVAAILKTFIDRLSDIIRVRKDLGRRMAGKSLWFATCGASPMPAFEDMDNPFKATAAYLDMKYGSMLYVESTKEGLHEETPELVELYAEEIRYRTELD